MLKLKKTETLEEKSVRAVEIAEMLLKLYKRRKTVLNFDSPWGCLVAVQLSAQCTDKRVNLVTPALFKRYPSVKDYALAGKSLSGVKEFENMIRSTGFYHNKAKNILAAASRVVENFDGKLPSTMEELLTLPGVARKSANVILFNAFGKVAGIAVDTHVKRITWLLGLISAGAVNNPVKIEMELMEILPRKYWGTFPLLLTEHGREVCIANRPKCRECGFNKLCPGARV
jgi:endonuclease-3